MRLSSAVSETALITLRARAVESLRARPILIDPMALQLREMLRQALEAEVSGRLLDDDRCSAATAHIALRARQYDRFVRDFRETHPRALVVNLGAGFDTRYWRVEREDWPYIELDLPEVVAAKKRLMGAMVTHPIIPCSVLDLSWIDLVLAQQRDQVLFLAEGLFMYLDSEAVRALLVHLARSFEDSEIVFETAHRRFTRPFLQRMTAAKFKRRFRVRDPVRFQFGLEDAHEIESMADGLHVLGEWSYLDAPDLRPAFLKLFRGLPGLRRNQWTVRARLGRSAINHARG